MQKFIVKGYITQLLYEDIEFKDKKTDELRIVKKCECVVKNIEDDQLLPVIFWGLDKISELFVDISEGAPVVVSFGIKSREYKNKIYLSLNGFHIEKYGGIPIEKKIENIEEKKSYNQEQKEKTFEEPKTFAEQEWEKSNFKDNSDFLKRDDDLPF